MNLCVKSNTCIIQPNSKRFSLSTLVVKFQTCGFEVRGLNVFGCFFKVLIEFWEMALEILSVPAYGTATCGPGGRVELISGCPG